MAQGGQIVELKDYIYGSELYEFIMVEALKSDTKRRFIVIVNGNPIPASTRKRLRKRLQKRYMQGSRINLAKIFK